MNSLAKRLCEQISSEIEIINELKENSLRFKDITVDRDLKAFELNNVSKRVILMKMIALQRQKDTNICELALSLGLHKNSSVKAILDSEKLGADSQQQLSDHHNKLETQIKELGIINSIVSTILLTSFKLNKAALNIFNVHGTIGSTYSRNVQVSAADKRSRINHKI